MTRSFIALTHLDFHKALAYNALTPVLIVILSLWWGNSLFQSFSGRRTRLADWAVSYLNTLIFLGIALVLVFDILRILFV